MKMHGEPSLTPISGPDSIWNRYLTEDCPNGLVPWSELGKLCRLRRRSSIVINVYSVVHERSWRELGLTMDKLGLEGMTVSQIKVLGQRQCLMMARTGRCSRTVGNAALSFTFCMQ